MGAIFVSVVVRRPIADVFAFAADARNNPLWQSGAGLKEVRQAPEDAVGVGTRITDVWRCMGHTTESITEVTEYEPNTRYTRRLIGGPGPIARGTHVFEPVAGGTRWTFSAQVEAGGVVAIAVPLLARALKRGFAAGMAEAKA